MLDFVVKTSGVKGGRKPQITWRISKLEGFSLLPWRIALATTNHLGNPFALQGARSWSSNRYKETQRKH